MGVSRCNLGHPRKMERGVSRLRLLSTPSWRRVDSRRARQSQMRAAASALLLLSGFVRRPSQPDTTCFYLSSLIVFSAFLAPHLSDAGKHVKRRYFPSQGLSARHISGILFEALAIHLGKFGLSSLGGCWTFPCRPGESMVPSTVT